MARLLGAGFPGVYELVEQHRFVSDLSALANALTYNNVLIDNISAKVERRQVALAFQKKFYRKELRKTSNPPSNKVLMNVKPGEANVTNFTRLNSRYNDYFVILMGQTAEKLLKIHPKATVALLTSYTAQKQRLQTMVNAMISAEVAGVERLEACTIDSAQGEQYDFVILDILIDNREPSLGFQSDPHRMNVATTRARNGLVIVTDLSALYRCRKVNRGIIARLLEQFKGCHYTIKDTDRLPQPKYYLPQEQY